MKKILCMVLCLLSVSTVCAKKYLATVNELPGYSFLTPDHDGYVNFYPDILNPGKHGYVVPTNIEWIIDTTAYTHHRDLYIMFNHEPKAANKLYQYWFLFGAWDGGKTHAMRYNGNGHSWGKDHNHFFIEEQELTYRVHNILPEARFTGNIWHPGGLHLALDDTYANAASNHGRGNGTPYQLSQLPYVSFSGAHWQNDFRNIKMLSFVDA